MILLKFLKQQNWWYAIPCVVLLYLFQYMFLGLGWNLIFATCFLVCYSLKYANKQDNLFIDQLKLGFYFLYFTSILLLQNHKELNRIVRLSFPMILFFLYFYTLLIFYKREMEKQAKPIKNIYWISVFILQTMIMLSIGIWAITQKVEADKQKELALIERNESIRQKRLADFSKEQAIKWEKLYLRQEELAEISKKEALEYKKFALESRELYEKERMSKHKK